MVQALLRQEGWALDHKPVQRLYKKENLSTRTELPWRKLAWRYREGCPGVEAANEVWSTNFMSDQVFDGGPIRILTVVDIHTREALSTAPRANFRVAQVTHAQIICHCARHHRVVLADGRSWSHWLLMTIRLSSMLPLHVNQRFRRSLACAALSRA